MTTARERYIKLESNRYAFLNTAVECSELTIPYLIRHDNESKVNHKKLVQPWQSVGS